MYVFACNKLVRDNILLHMQQDDFTLDFEVLNDKDYVLALKDKLVEEALEVQDSKNQEELLDELADVMEVFQSLCKACGITKQQVLERQMGKHQQRGGFQGRNKVHKIKLDSNKPAHSKWIAYFRGNPSKYPQSVENPSDDGGE